MSGIDAQLDLTGFVSGTVTDENGEPIPNIFIDFYSLDADGFPSGEGFGGTTNDLGRFHVPFVAPGDYVIGFTDLSGTYVNEYYDDHLNIFDGELVHVSAGAGHHGHRRRAGVRRSPVGHRDRLRGQRPGRHQARARHPPRRGLGVVRRGVHLHHHEDGAYQIDGLPTGTYRVEFNDPARTYLSERYDDQLPIDEGTPITVTAPGTTDRIDASLAKAARVTGTVTDGAGEPIEGIFVALRGLEDGNW